MKRLIFILSLFLIPFLFFAVLEGALRLAGVGHSTALFEQKGDYFYLNPSYPALFFSRSEASIPQVIEQRIPVTKQANTLRIVCLGGSTTAGFPFEVNINFPHFLKDFLEANAPGTQWEVINLGISAINSHAVRFMLPEILKLKPDLIVVYMGHNEFYGALGLASTGRLGSNPGVIQFVLHLRRLRIYQALEMLINRFLPSPKPAAKTLMARMIKMANIPLSSPIRQKTAQNFEQNLSLILNRLRRADVPVVLSTISSNLKNQEPLGYNPLTQEKQIRAFLQKQDFVQAIALLQKALQADSTNPLTHFLLGRAYYGQERFSQAKRHFVLARDFDLVPFRAPSNINRIIRKHAKNSNVLLVDMDSLFCSLAAHGIPGNTLFLEHLHPTANGYRAMGRAFAAAVLKQLSINNSKGFSNIPRCYTNLDLAIGELKIADLVQNPPFNSRTNFRPRIDDPPVLQFAQSHVFKKLLWDAAHFSLGDYYFQKQLFDSARNEFSAVLHVDSLHVTALYKLGDVNLVKKNFKKALLFYQRAVKVNPEAAFLQAKLGRALFLSGNVRRANNVINHVLQSQNLKSQLGPRQLAELWYLKALCLRQLNKTGQAQQALRQALKLFPEHQRAAQLLQELD